MPMYLFQTMIQLNVSVVMADEKLRKVQRVEVGMKYIKNV